LFHFTNEKHNPLYSTFVGVKRLEGTGQDCGSYPETTGVASVSSALFFPFVVGVSVPYCSITHRFFFFLTWHRSRYVINPIVDACMAWMDTRELEKVVTTKSRGHFSKEKE
jgi:hypothetical protein